ncbi:hypothetical protein DPMN_014209 [Dreissena polymorpha]|uniref:Uncharacterized protein n=1 Tax=Dreissena polymorpha TaxID=45954 RepID=A0A9D4N5K9_DREPO|nr:hypothetical protein DPMN_014209 [Dreissena polymorpha]
MIGTNLLTKFHEHRKINVASRVKNVPPPGSHVFQPTGIIFELIQDIIGMNLLTKFHEDRTVNVASREKCPAQWSHFHDDRKINVVSRVLTRFYYSHIKKMPRPRGGNFHEDRTINVASRVENAPPLGSHVFPANATIFKVIQDIIRTNLLTKFHEDRTINILLYSHIGKNAPPLGSHVFPAKFHEDWKINVASILLIRFYYSHIRKNAPPPGGHVFQPTGIIFELFHEDLTINVVSRPYKKKCPPLGSHVFQANVTIFELIQSNVDGARRTTGDHKISP